MMLTIFCNTVGTTNGSCDHLERLKLTFFSHNMLNLPPHNKDSRESLLMNPYKESQQQKCLCLQK